jgi:hypothetical protein
MFCPKCRSEYEPGYTRCHDCEVELIHELPPLPPSSIDYVEYDEILVTNSPTDVAFLKSLLDACDISYFFQGEHTSPYVYYAVPMRLMVRKDEVEKAAEILKDSDLSYTFGGQHKTGNEDEEA